MPRALISIYAYPLCPITTHLQPVQHDKGPLCRRSMIKLPPSELYMSKAETRGPLKDHRCVQNINIIQLKKIIPFYTYLDSALFIHVILDSFSKS